MNTEILIVEDSATQAQLLAAIIARQGYIPVIATNGRRGMEAVRSSPPALVISDIVMPEMNGYEFCAALKQDPDFGHIPVILLTTLSDPNDIVRGLQAGADGYVTKPFDVKILLSRITTFLEMPPEPPQLPNLPLDVVYAGQHHQVHSGRRQMLNLLLGVYEDAVQQNKTLTSIQLELKRLNENLEEQVASRTTALREEIGQRKQAEQELLQERSALAQRIDDRTRELRLLNTELAHALQTRDNFLAMMSHELRTPLNAVLGLGEILQEGIYGDLNDKQLEAITIISESGGHLLTLINDILDLSKISANMLELSCELITLTDICRVSLNFVRQAAAKKGITIVEKVEEVEDFYADARRLKQILVNLLTNAVKFTSSGGAIGLEVTGDATARQVQIVVWDTGQGIAPDHLKVIFNPFVQVDDGLTRQFEGTGLGLTMVEHLVSMHKGQIDVVSEVGKGSRFTVKLPWLTQPEITAEPAEPEAVPLVSYFSSDDQYVTQPGNFCILLVEDNEPNFQTMLGYLTAKGFNVELVSDGLEVLSKTRQIHPDLIIMDIQLPNLNGLEATRQIKADPTLTDIPVIAVTAFALPGDRERCLEAGATEYYSKPLPMHDLMNQIVGLMAERTDLHD